MEKSYIENRNNDGWYYRAAYDKSGRRVVKWTQNLNQAWSTDQPGVMKYMLRTLNKHHTKGLRSLGI